MRCPLHIGGLFHHDWWIVMILVIQIPEEEIIQHEVEAEFTSHEILSWAKAYKITCPEHCQMTSTDCQVQWTLYHFEGSPCKGPEIYCYASSLTLHRRFSRWILCNREMRLNFHYITNGWTIAIKIPCCTSEPHYQSNPVTPWWIDSYWLWPKWRQTDAIVNAIHLLANYSEFIYTCNGVFWYMILIELTRVLCVIIHKMPINTTFTSMMTKLMKLTTPQNSHIIAPMQSTAMPALASAFAGISWFLSINSSVMKSHLQWRNKTNNIQNNSHNQHTYTLQK